ncbi:hypothetical protein KW823_23670, partial [Enterobacter quasiroggenkampii]|nr:hypothetical protein [Enterobacter quasiroggenkampii]
MTELAAAQSFGSENKDMLLEGESPLQASEGAAPEQAGSHMYKDVEEMDLAAVENQLTALQQDVQSFIQNARAMEGLMEQLLKDAAGKQWELQQLSSSYQSSDAALRDANHAWKEAEESLA